MQKNKKLPNSGNMCNKLRHDQYTNIDQNNFTEMFVYIKTDSCERIGSNIELTKVKFFFKNL